jgi:hydrogenase nickel incorporation protein HypB
MTSSHGVEVIRLVSRPGSGRTALSERLLADFGRQYRVIALVGDLATQNDAARSARTGAAVKQITTGTVCHVDATMIEKALQDWQLTEKDFLFIENVGNLVCPSAFDLGERLRLVLVSTTEGEDKPLKYPTIFNSADIAVVTKLDLAEAAWCYLEESVRSVNSVRPSVPIVKLSTRTGESIDLLKGLLTSQYEARDWTNWSHLPSWRDPPFLGVRSTSA